MQILSSISQTKTFKEPSDVMAVFYLPFIRRHKNKNKSKLTETKHAIMRQTISEEGKIILEIKVLNDSDKLTFFLRKKMRLKISYLWLP